MNLQRLRAEARGLKRISRTIFGPRLKGDYWTFHHGGRDELQFNVGLDVMTDRTRAFRAGVAFSFKTSQSLQDIDVLVPKVALFNSWVRQNLEAISDLKMWHWHDGIRSHEYRPAPIPETLVQRGNFVFSRTPAKYTRD